MASDQPVAGAAEVPAVTAITTPILAIPFSFAGELTPGLLSLRFPLAGKWTPRAAAIHAIVQRMQDECIAGVRPGARFDHLHMHAEDVAVDGLLRLGVLRGDRDDVLRAGTVAAFFPHYLGHHVGLEVHDVSGALPIAAAQGLGLDGGKRAMVTPKDSLRMRADRAAEASGHASSRARERQDLRPNMIVTVEPGM